MKNIHTKALIKGKVIKAQKFETQRGTYTINIIRYRGELYFYKYLDGVLMECCNLSGKDKEDEEE